MANDQKHDDNTEEDKPSLLKTVFIIAVIIGISAALVMVIYSSEPEATREGATKQTAMLVSVKEVKKGTYRPKIAGLGVVEPAQDIQLSPRVEGYIISIADEFIPGGFVSQGDELVKIDPADYFNVVLQRESELNQARAELAIEEGRQEVAKKEYKLLDRDLTAENEALVLRQPQLEIARALVIAQEAMLNQAQLNHERTSVVAPFNAQIISRDVNVGSQVQPSMMLARLVGVDEYWVKVTVPVSKLDQIAFPADGGAGAIVKLRNRSLGQKDKFREGQVLRLIGSLDEQTRLARILVRVKDPLNLNTDTDAPKMIIGSIMQAEIQGSPIQNVVRIDRDYLHDGDVVWVKKDGKLEIREAAVVFKDKEYAYISEGLDDGDQLVVSNLATVSEGVALRTEVESESQDQSQNQGQETSSAQNNNQ